MPFVNSIRSLILPTLAVPALALTLAACGSRSIVPDVDDVITSREAAPKNCRDIGAITGTTASVKGTQEDAVEDLKKEAANKGANYVVVKEFSGYGTSVTGHAYVCP